MSSLSLVEVKPPKKQFNFQKVCHRFKILVAFVFVCSFGAGCASTSVFKSYPDQVKPVIEKLESGQVLDPELFKKEVASKDKTIYLMERGRVRQLLGDHELSKQDYDAAVQTIKEDDEKAKVTASDAAAQAASILLNDNAIPYNAPGYERVFLRYFQAVNYLSAGDIDGARVEIANADAEQKEAEERYAKEVEKAEAKAAEEREKKAKTASSESSEGNSAEPDESNDSNAENESAASKSSLGGLGGAFGSLKKMASSKSPGAKAEPETPSKQAGFGQVYDLVKSSLNEQYAGLDETVGKVKNSFQNAAAFYMSGLIYEALDDHNNAYISFKKALELSPDNKFLQTDVSRIALVDAREEDLADFKAKFGLSDEAIRATIPAEGQGSVVVLYEGGYVAPKKEVKIPIPLFGVDNSPQGGKDVTVRGASFIAFPIYEITTNQLGALSVSTENLTSETMSLCNVNSLAVKNLKERIPVMLTRQVLRFVVKSAAVKAAHDNGGALAGLAASVAVGATEKADLRSWLTLPQEIQVCRMVLPAGEQELAISSGSGIAHQAKVNVVPGKTTLVRVVDAGVNATLQSLVF